MSAVLLDSPRTDAASFLVSGATGYLGSLTTAALLRNSNATVVTPIREKHSRTDVEEMIRSEVIAQGLSDTQADVALKRLRIVTLPERPRMDELTDTLRSLNVTEFIHCAGSVDYFNSHLLHEVNVEFTRALLSLGKRVGITRFVFVSTAFCSGYTDDPIGEHLHPEPNEEDPTEYTRSKRMAERDVVESGIPYLILRPSIVSGDSKSGRYTGRAYGIYQFLNAADRLLIGKDLDSFHVVAASRPLPIVHQDAYLDTLLASLRYVSNNRIVHQVSAQGNLPTMRHMLDYWLSQSPWFHEVFVYDSLDAVPMSTLTRRMRMWVEFSAVNTEIATHTWNFETTTIEAMRKRGLIPVCDANRQTIETCIDVWINRSTKFQSELAQWTQPKRVAKIVQC